MNIKSLAATFGAAVTAVLLATGCAAPTEGGSFPGDDQADAPAQEIAGASTENVGTTSQAVTATSNCMDVGNGAYECRNLYHPVGWNTFGYELLRDIDATGHGQEVEVTNTSAVAVDVWSIQGLNVYGPTSTLQPGQSTRLRRLDAWSLQYLTFLNAPESARPGSVTLTVKVINPQIDPACVAECHDHYAAMRKGCGLVIGSKTWCLSSAAAHDAGCVNQCPLAK